MYDNGTLVLQSTYERNRNIGVFGRLPQFHSIVLRFPPSVPSCSLRHCCPVVKTFNTALTIAITSPRSEDANERIKIADRKSPRRESPKRSGRWLIALRVRARIHGHRVHCFRSNLLKCTSSVSWLFAEECDAINWESQDSFSLVWQLCDLKNSKWFSLWLGKLCSYSVAKKENFCCKQHLWVEWDNDIF